MWTRSRVLSVAAVVAVVWSSPPSSFAAGPKVGAPAPEFKAAGLSGQERQLSEFKGKFVVLEWHNQGCPFVRKHYSSGNMQRLQKEVTGAGAVWLTVITSPPGKEGFVTPDEEKKYLAENKATPTDVLFDSDGAVGRLYGAKTTPHMFVIDDHGVLVYAGAIDDRPSTDVADVDGAKNYVRAAFDDAKAGKPVTTATTAPYGCSVKYKE